MNCPKCGCKPTYIGATSLDCSNPICDNFPGGKQTIDPWEKARVLLKKNKPNKMKGMFFGCYVPDNVPEIELSIESLFKENKPTEWRKVDTHKKRDDAVVVSNKDFVTLKGYIAKLDGKPNKNGNVFTKECVIK